MTKRTAMFLRLALLLVLAPDALLAQVPAGPSPVGKWRTFDDRTGQERGLVAIEDTAGFLSGRIAGILDPKEASRVCELCKDARKNQPILGLTILTGMRRDGDRWDGGEILDPQTGAVYQCAMRLEDGGAKLVVRGYVGLSLFGRSQIWLRQADKH